MSAQKVNTSTPWHVSFVTPHPLPSIYFKRANGWAHVYLLTRTIVGGGGRAGPELDFEGWVHVGVVFGHKRMQIAPDTCDASRPFCRATVRPQRSK